MAFDDDTDDERPIGAGPLPPDDRLWRHPSELARAAAPATAPPPPRSSPRRTVAAAAVGAGLTGAALGAAAMWAFLPSSPPVGQVQAGGVTVTTASFARPGLDAPDAADTMAPSLTTVWAERAGQWRQATAVWLDDQGDLVVALTVVAGADKILVGRPGGSRTEAELLGTDAATGIATLAVRGSSGTPLERRSAAPTGGQAVSVLASPATVGSGDADARSLPASITTTGRRIVLDDQVLGDAVLDDLVLHDAIELDRNVPSDMVGGLVVGDDGTVIGLVVAGEGPGQLAVVVPIGDALDAARDLRDDGQVRRAWLGVEAVDLAPDDATRIGVSGGAVLTAVTDGSPAASVGLVPDDVVLAVHDQVLDDASDLVVALRSFRPGSSISLRWVHDGTMQIATVTLGG